MNIKKSTVSVVSFCLLAFCCGDLACFEGDYKNNTSLPIRKCDRKRQMCYTVVPCGSHIFQTQTRKYILIKFHFFKLGLIENMIFDKITDLLK